MPSTAPTTSIATPSPTADGNVTEIYFNPDAGTFQTVIDNVPDLAKISAYYAANDKFFNRRVEVLTNAGRIYEIRYNPDFGIMRVLGKIGPGATPIWGMSVRTPKDCDRIQSLSNAQLILPNLQSLGFNCMMVELDGSIFRRRLT